MGFSIGSSGIRTGGPGGTLAQYADKVEGRSFNLRVLWHLLIFVRPYALRMIVAFVAMLIASALTLVAPFLVKMAIDGPIANGDIEGLNRIVLAMLLALAGFVSGVDDPALFAKLGWTEGSGRFALGIVSSFAGAAFGLP